MSSARTIARNIGFLFFTEIVDKLISFFLVILITRYLGDVGFGKYSFAFAFISLFVMFSHMGVLTYAFREIAKHRSKARKLINNMLSMRISILAVLYAIAILIELFFPMTREIFTVLLLVMVHELFGALSNMVEILFKAYEKTEFTLYSRLIEKGLALAFHPVP